MPGLVKKGNIMYKPLNETLTTPPVLNPHSPAASGYKQQPVDIPGVLHQTRQLFQPVIAIPPETPAK
jgi:hypothetical protein